MKPNNVKYISKKIMQAGEIPLLWGHFGIGKTDIAKQIAQENNKKLIILVISQMEPGDLIGMPNRNNGKTEFLKPDWWPEDENTIIMIDEINRAHRSIRNAIMQLLIDKKIHNHVLPNNTWVMAAANPPDEEYDQVDLITDPAFMSRFFHISITPNKNDWINWSQTQSLNTEIINFIDNYPEYLSDDNQISLKLNLRPSPRSWHKFSKVYNLLNEEDKEKYTYMLASSILGSEGAQAFINFKNKKTNLPDIELLLIEGKEYEILNNLSIEDKNNLIIKINKYIENLEDDVMINFIENAKHKLIANNIYELNKYIPKDSLFSILRNIDNLTENSKGIRRAFYDKLFEELAINLEDVKWMKEL